MKKWILSFLFILQFAVIDVLGDDDTCYGLIGCSIHYNTNSELPLNVKISDNHRDIFFVGETVAIPIETEGCQCRRNEYRETDCNCELSYTLTEGNISLQAKHNEFLTQTEIDAYYDTDVTSCVYDCHWRNQQSFWMELTGLASEEGSYKGILTVRRVYRQNNEDLSETKNVMFSFEVKPLTHAENGFSPPNSKATIVSRDVAASYNAQAEIYSYLKNNTNSKQTLDNPYMDYYMTLPNESGVGVFSIWSIPENSCLQVLDCGNDNYVLRQQYKGQRNLESGESLKEFQLALYDAKNSFTNMNYFVPMSEKISEISANKDYSYLYPAENYALSAARNTHYNYKMASFEGDGSLLYGTPPNWFNSSCRAIMPEEHKSGALSKIRYRNTSSANLKFCTDESFSNNSTVNTNLTVQFFDEARDNQKQGLFNFRIANTGTTDVPIGGYEMRFYYGGDPNIDASLIKFYQGAMDGATFSNEKCSENQYILKVKLNANAIAKANGLYPEYYNIGFTVQTEAWTDIGKSSMFSWNGASILTDNPKMGLFDADGHLVYGEPHLGCGEAVVEHLPKIVVYEREGLIEYQYYDENLHRQVVIPKGMNVVSLDVKNEGDADVEGPVYVNYYITHPDGQNPLFIFNGIEVSTANVEVQLRNDLSVVRTSVGNKHVYRFILKNGLKSRTDLNISFSLRDVCIDCVSLNEANEFFVWNIDDDWSADPAAKNRSTITERVVVLSKDGAVLYGKGDTEMPTFKEKDGNGNSVIEIPGIEVQKQFPNRTDAIAYSGGQLLSNGGFEEPSLASWNVDNGKASSVRGETVQGSRFLKLRGKIGQKIPTSTMRILSDSGAVLTFWHKCDYGMSNGTTCNVSLKVASLQYNFTGSSEWKRETIFFSRNQLKGSQIRFSFETNTDVDFDDMILVPGKNEQPSTYAVRFTTTQHEELETRAYDGEQSLLITSSKRDLMGRPMYKYLPFELNCSDALDCNSEARTLEYPDMAKEFYDGSKTSYPDAGGFPYVETRWKPDPAATKDVEGAPGKAFSLAGNHVIRAYSSGVNLTGIDMMDFNSLASAVNAVQGTRTYDNAVNFHAAKDSEPTHIWELNLDQNGNAAFTVKDGDGHVIISGALKKTGATGNGSVVYELATRSVNELDSRGNVIKSHPPMSCEYTNSSTNCVAPSTYEYDSQSRVIKTVEPDAGETHTYYDLVGRVRATQTQRQIDSGAYSVVGYDHLDRAIYTGEWKTTLDCGDVRAYFNNEDNMNSPKVDSLTPGTITRTFYDREPARTLLGVELYPEGKSLGYTRGRVAAIISDVGFDDVGNVIRVSTANSYDKYGRVVASYTYDPTLPVDLRMMAVETEYDLSGKVLASTKYPYGLTTFGRMRGITETYTYDRLGRVSDIYTKNGNGSQAILAHYDYYPTGSVKTITMGNAITLSYTYHISGAVKTAMAKDSRGNSLYSETLYYEDCGSGGCIPQYNGNISRMIHHLAHGNGNYGEFRNVQYTYDELNRLTKIDDSRQNVFDEIFAYDAQGRITAQRRAGNIANPTGGEYSYYEGKNSLKSVANGIGGTADSRNMSVDSNFIYDSEGNLTEDKSKDLKILYDWRGMPIEFIQEPQPTGCSVNSLFRLTMEYDGTGRRISKTRWVKSANSQDWEKELVTHYTGIGTEIRESFTGANAETKVVVNMPNGLGRYGIEDAVEVNANASKNFEWYLKNHLGSTMLVYGTVASTNPNEADVGEKIAAYDYRSFGEIVELTPPSTGKVTENFTGKEHDDEISLDYFGARYLDPMLGMWVSVDPARQFASPYLYAGNGYNPVNVIDPDGNYTLNLNEDNTVAGMVDDGNLDMVSVFNADGILFGEFNAPPAQSYFRTENLIGQKFDPNMQAKAEKMLNLAFDAWPCDAPAWGTGGELDFKNAYYGKDHFTIGVLNGTMMTAEDAGNAMWGGWTHHMYLAPYWLSRAIANAVQLKSNGRLEDSQSSAMQIWGYANFKP